MVGALQEAGLTRIEQAVILGAGGTAQSALAAVRELGHESPIVLVRNLARTGELRETAERLQMRPTISDGLLTEPLPAADLVISTLPGGAADPLSSTRWRPGSTVLDVVYAPWPTPFARSALAAWLPGGQWSDRAAVRGGCPGGADDWSDRPSGGDADRPSRRGGCPAGLNRRPRCTSHPSSGSTPPAAPVIFERCAARTAGQRRPPGLALPGLLGWRWAGFGLVVPGLVQRYRHAQFAQSSLRVARGRRHRARDPLDGLSHAGHCGRRTATVQKFAERKS